MIAEEKDFRIILARKDHAKDEMLGEIVPLFEIEDGVIFPITEHNFCPTMRVFIKSNYDEIERKFPEDEMFKITITVSEKKPVETEAGRPHCKYVASGRDAEAVRPKDYIQIVQHALPEPSSRFLQVNIREPGTKYIFIEDQGFLYGPFRWQKEDENEIKIDFIETPLPNVRLASYQIYKIDAENERVENAITVSRNDNVKLLSDLGVISIPDAVEFYDYASDDEVMRFCAKAASAYSSKLIDKKQVETIVATINKKPIGKTDIYKNRLSRFIDIGNEIQEVKQDIADALDGFFKTEGGKNAISKHIESNEEIYLSKIKKAKEDEIEQQLEGRRQEVNEINERINELNQTKSKLSIEVEKKREEASSSEQIQAASRATDKQLEEKYKEIERVESYIEEMKPLVKGFKKIDDLNIEIKVLERQNTKLLETKQSLNYETQALKAQYESADNDLRKRLSDLRPFVDQITGGYYDSNTPEHSLLLQTVPAPSAESFVERQKIIVDWMSKKLKDNGRYLDDWQIANLLISTQQSFITFLAGLPGVGKTSLARLLIDVQGLKSRSKEIAVARGWTGQKDIIGYYNPLASRFQHSNTGLYHFLVSLDKEKDRDIQDNAMAYVLLDEANLSPIEHYWSSFMGMTDSNEDRSLILGDNWVNITSGLRFISTINYDGTTEPLSPRVVDRAPVIVLDPSDAELFDDNVDLISKDSSVVFPLSVSDMDTLFGLEKTAPELENDEKPIFDNIKQILMGQGEGYGLGRPVSISPRKELAIRQFCGKARAVMREHSDLRAFDVAILQHVLPLIRGNGPSFAKRIEMLKLELQRADLSLSANYIQRIQVLGEEDLHSYDFFCW